MRINLTTPMSDDKERQRRNEVILAAIERHTEKHMNDDHTATSQPTQSDAVVKLLETMRERCAHPCRSEKAELGCDCDAARQAAVMLRQPTQSDALQADALDFGNELIFACAGLHHEPINTEAIFSITWDGFPYDVTIRAALQEQSK